MTLDHLWAGWRSAYIDEHVAGTSDAQVTEGGSVFSRLLASGSPDEVTGIVHRAERCFTILNRFPYVSGHLLVMPYREVAELAALTDEEHRALWDEVRSAVAAVTAAYSPDGINIGANLGAAAGAGVPGHLHIHVLPRWQADSNFMTAIAGARVLPEALPATWAKLTAAWPAP